MLGDFIYSGEVDNATYEYETPYKNTNSRKSEKILRFILVTAVTVICGGLIILFGVNSSMVPAKIEVEGFPGFGKAEALAYAGIGGGATYLSINAEKLERSLAGYPLVESAKVVKHFPDRLSIYLEQRHAVAVVLARVNGKTRPVYFDRNGVAFKIGNDTSELMSSWMPVISGILGEGESFKLGTRLSSAYLPLFSQIEEIYAEDPGIWQAISEIGIAKKANGLFDLVLYPVHNTTRLRMLNKISKSDIYYALLMLDVYRQTGDIPYEIDVRSGLGVVKAKEGGFGE